MTDKYNPSEELKEHLRNANIISYRLVDGSYVIAEEVDHDPETNVIYIASAVQLDVIGSRGAFSPWLETDEDEMIQLVGDKIVGRSETPLHLKMDYHRFYIYQKLRNVLTKDELKKIVNEIFNPPVDDQDLMEDIEHGEEWKVDNGIATKSPMDYHTEWRKKHQRKNND